MSELSTLAFALTMLALLSLAACSEYCHNEVFQATCGPGEVILLETALYGRMRMGRCVKTDFGFVGCNVDVMDKAERRCSARRRCQIRVPDAIFDGMRPCNEDLKSYFEASFRCIPVVLPEPQRCKVATEIRLNAESGYLASLVTMETECGSWDHPWLIEAKPGQRINLTLMDFSEFPVDNPPLESVICEKYATLRELQSSRTVDVCGGLNTPSQTYTSLTNELLVSVDPHEMYSFLLKYEVIGCPDIRPPPNTWTKRREHRLTVGCASSGTQWTLICKGTTWYGKVGNCTKEENVTSGFIFSAIPFPIGLAVVLGLLVTLTVGGIILIIGLAALRRRSLRLSRQQRRNESMISVPAYTDEQGEIKSANTATGMTEVPMGYFKTTTYCSPENDYAYVWEGPDGVLHQDSPLATKYRASTGCAITYKTTRPPGEIHGAWKTTPRSGLRCYHQATPVNEKSQETECCAEDHICDTIDTTCPHGVTECRMHNLGTIRPYNKVSGAKKESI